MRTGLTRTLLAAALCAAIPAIAQDVPKANPGNRKYSPYPEQNFPNRVFFGDTHLHSSYSTDSGMLGNTLGPEEAFRFARGETVTSSTGIPARLRRPLDFVVLTDHAENLGLAPALRESNPLILKSEWGRQQHELVRQGTLQGLIQAFENWLSRVSARDDPTRDIPELKLDMWRKITTTAEKYNDPGRFTALIGFEWTSQPGGVNLHRNVVFRDGKQRADQIVPFSSYDGEDPEQLWAFMDAYEKKTGGRAMAIAHNGNMSNGVMFDDVTFTQKKPLDRAYAEKRMRWEPVYEVTQIKGDGETHPVLSPTDEFAAFERWDTISIGSQPKAPGMLPREYARQALKTGLAHEAKFGANPFKFGMIGSTDSHTSLATSDENNFFGKVVALEPTADEVRFNEIMFGRNLPKNYQIVARQSSASGLAGVWARDNTREAIWDALARKEVYATSGTRLMVRVFGGFDFSPADLQRSDFAGNGYAKGVPMGGDLKAAPSGKAPGFLIRAVRDPDGANLDRVQVVKGWLDAQGRTHEKVYDVVWSGNRKPAKGGKLPPVGNTVNVAEATYTNAIGAPVLETYWKDPAFDPKQRAFYYVRVIEIPTPRWTTYDAKFFGVALPKDVPASLQDRAYTSPIWYTPG
jgi:hypothetical protein